MIIMEYCKYGAVLHFLVSQRESFENQFNFQSDTIILKLIQRANINEENNACLTVNQWKNQNDQRFLEKKTDTTNWPSPISFNDETLQSSKISFNTTDLVNWALQIANGMKFLANLKIVHGDLASRNLLLDNSLNIKICDFGLAKRVYENENYKKLKGKQLFPVKWYAIEAIEDQKLSTEADVWSYGVCLWELFSLGKIPYAEIEVIDLGFLEKLYNGYRLKRPRFCSKTIYNLMWDCWNINPLERPTFQDLHQKFESFFQKGYIEANCSYDNLAKSSNEDWRG